MKRAARLFIGLSLFSRMVTAQENWTAEAYLERGMALVEPACFDRDGTFREFLCREGLEALQAGLSLQPRAAQGHLALGQALLSYSQLSAGHHEELRSDGIAHLREAMRLNPRLAEAPYQLALALNPGGVLDEEGVALLEKASALDPKRVACYRYLWVAYLEAGQVGRAMATYERFRRRLPLTGVADDGTWTEAGLLELDLADRLVHRGETAAAVRIYTAALRALAGRPVEDQCVQVRGLDLPQFRRFPDFQHKVKLLRERCPEAL